MRKPHPLAVLNLYIYFAIIASYLMGRHVADTMLSALVFGFIFIVSNFYIINYIKKAGQFDSKSPISKKRFFEIWEREGFSGKEVYEIWKTRSNYDADRTEIEEIKLAQHVAHLKKHQEANPPR